MYSSNSILAEIGIDAAEIEQRLAFLAFNEHDADLLKSMHDVLGAERERIIEAFYAHLEQFPEIRPLLGDTATLAHLKRAQTDYFGQLTQGRYDQAYAENRLHVGVVHQRIGLTPKWYLSAYCKYLSEVMPLVLEHHAGDTGRALAACRALLKVIFFDMGLALDTYFHAENKALLLAHSYTEQIVSNMPIGFIVLDQRAQIHLANNAVLRMLRLDSNTPWQQRQLGELLDVPALDEKIMWVLKTGKQCTDCGFERKVAGVVHSYVADISLARMGEEPVVMFMLQDVTLRKRSEEEIHRLAFYDSLTQLPNRRLLHERLLQSMSLSERSGRHGALMFIDLDHFKTINDTQGHDVGDLLLKEVAARLKRNVREGDTVARLGGDEFVVTLEGLSTDASEAASHTETIAEKIRSELSQPYLLKDTEHHSSPSIGISLYRGQEFSLDEVLKQADLAMYQAKAAGRNMLCFFDPTMQAVMEHRAELEKDLRASIRLQQLQLYYQMQVDDSGRVVAAEALIRWQHPQRGLVSPCQFIPLAEEIGMIIPIGDWVIEQACAQLKQWEMEPAMRDIELSVNISTRQLSQPYFTEHITESLERSGIRPSRLKLELTESFILHNVEEAIEKMEELRHIGIRFALDDFGIGYSSLSYLKRLPLEQLKIDQSFIHDIARDRNGDVMVRTIIDIANNFGLKVVAEGVEADEQLAFLRQYGCNRYQGYLFGKPVPVSEFERLCKLSRN